MLEAELEMNLVYAKGDKANKNTDDSRNGYSKKKVKNQSGENELDLSRDRQGSFGPVVVPKNKRDISGIEKQVISPYTKGMTTRDIHDQIKDIYGIEV